MRKKIVRNRKRNFFWDCILSSGRVKVGERDTWSKKLILSGFLGVRLGGAQSFDLP